MHPLQSRHHAAQPGCAAQRFARPGRDGPSHRVAWAGAWLVGITLGVFVSVEGVAEPGPTAGAAAYAGCAVCHGVDGAGRVDGTFPRIAGQHASVTTKQIDDIRSGRRGNPIMAGHVEALTDPEEVADIAAYVESLSPDSGNGRAEGEDVERGGLLYQRDCARCHGAQGQGRAESFVPVVAGQHYAYLLRQLRAIAASRRLNAHPEMVEAVFDYPDDDLRAVAGYLAQLPWPPPATER